MDACSNFAWPAAAVSSRSAAKKTARTGWGVAWHRSRGQKQLAHSLAHSIHISGFTPEKLGEMQPPKQIVPTVLFVALRRGRGMGGQDSKKSRCIELLV